MCLCSGLLLLLLLVLLAARELVEALLGLLRLPVLVVIERVSARERCQRWLGLATNWPRRDLLAALRLDGRRNARLGRLEAAAIVVVVVDRRERARRRCSALVMVVV